MENRVLCKVPCGAGIMAQTNSQANEETKYCQILPQHVTILQQLGFSKDDIIKAFDMLPKCDNMELEKLMDLLYDIEENTSSAKSFTRTRDHDKELESGQKWGTKVEDGRQKEMILQWHNKEECAENASLNGSTLMQGKTATKWQRLDSAQESFPSKADNGYQGDRPKISTLRDMSEGFKLSDSQQERRESTDQAKSNNSTPQFISQNNTSSTDIGTNQPLINHHNKEEKLEASTLEAFSGQQEPKKEFHKEMAEETEAGSSEMVSGAVKHREQKEGKEKLTEEERVKIRKLKEERKHLLANKICNKCHINDINLLTLPCRHMITCEACGETMDNCLKCDKKIIATVKIFKL